MFKYIVLYFVLSVAALTQCQPISNEKNRSIASSVIEGASATASQFGNQAANIGAQVANIGAQATGAAVNTVHNIGAQAANAVTGAASQISNKIQQEYENQKATLGQVIDRLGDAARLTVIEERESIAKALKSIGTATGHTFQAGLDALGSGWDMILIVPKFAFNAIGINRPPATVTF